MFLGPHRLGTSQNGSLFAICNPLICSLKPVKSGFLSDFFISKKNLYTQNGLYWVVLGSKLFLFSLNLFVKTYVFQLVRSSENVPDDKHLKVFKVANLFFEGKFILWPKQRNWIICGHQIITFEFFSISVHQVILKLDLMRGIEKQAKVTLGVNLENSFYAQNGENGSIIRIMGPLWLHTFFKLTSCNDLKSVKTANLLAVLKPIVNW